MATAGAAAPSPATVAPQAASEPTLTSAHTAIPDAAVTRAAPNVGGLFTAHRPILAAAGVSLLLLPLVLLARLRPPIPVPANAGRRSHSTPPRRGPPTFLAR
jgi:hypothetical protein